MPPKNPWKSISWKNTIAKDDIPCIRHLLFSTCTNPADKPYCIHDELLPEPFMGDLHSEVYVLNGNPGYSQLDSFYKGDGLLEQLIKDNLNLKVPNLLWLDSAKPIRQKYINNGGKWPVYAKSGNKIKDGYEWWNEAAGKLVRLLSHTPRFCNIEYFPYHTEKKDKIMKIKNLPSNAFADWYVRDAIRNEKWIIIVRCFKEWLERIPELQVYNQYSGRVLVGDSARVYLTQHNLKRKTDISRTSWADLINNL